MILYTYTVVLFIGIAGIFSNYYKNYTNELFLGLLAPILVGYVMIYLLEKHSNMKLANHNRMLIKGFAIKFIFHGTYILTIFTVYSFNPIPFMCSFVSSFIGLHIVEALVLKKNQYK
tara:strand:- start:242 stop:592 length:351 start_codon:yes stop_codon:yes gene_type:complete